MARLILLHFVALALSCGTPTPNNSETDAGTTPTDSGSTTTNSNGDDASGGTECADLSEQFIDAVRDMPRACSTNADCKLVARAQVCDCDLAVSASSDTAAYDAVRADLDAAQCPNPFGCPMGECPYRRLADPGELVANCSDEGTCEVVQVLPCSEYEARAHGGIVPPGACSDASQCQLRDDLNPCGCSEGISTNFPFLTVQATYAMMEINDARCNVQCMGCESPGEAICAADTEGTQVCQTM